MKSHWSSSLTLLVLAASPALAGGKGIAKGGCVIRPEIRANGPIGPITGQGKVEVTPNVARISLTFTDERRVSPRAEVSRELKTGNLGALRESHARRLDPILAEIKGIVASPLARKPGESAAAFAARKAKAEKSGVRSSSSDVAIQEWEKGKDKKSEGRSVFKGHSIVTRVEVTLKGSEASIKERLGALYDSELVRPDNSDTDPVYEVSDKSRQRAEQRALQKAMADARNQAEGYLQEGEELGRILERGETSVEEGYRRHARSVRAAATLERAPAADAPQNLGQRLFNLGKEAVEKTVRVIWEAVPGFRRPYPEDPRRPFPPPILRPLTGPESGVNPDGSPKKISDV